MKDEIFFQPAWSIENFLEVRDGRLTVGGASAVRLVEEFGSPLYVFGEARIRQNVSRMRAAQEVIDSPLKICYAAKANSNMGILNVVREAGSDLEVNSGGELFKALKAGFAPEQIIFNGTSKTGEELEMAIDAGIYAVQADSLYEIELIEAAARRLNKTANVSLRLVPEIETGTLHGLQTALLTSKFGMMRSEVFEAFDRWKNSASVNLCGIHLHLGSQNPQPEPYAEALKTLFENLLEIYRTTGRRLSHLNLGGGFPVNYLRDKSQEEDFSGEQVAYFSASLEPKDVLKEAWQKVKKAANDAGAAHLLEEITLLLEPGRSVIADAGIILTTVRNKKSRPLKSQIRNSDFRIEEDIWLLTDAGFNLMLSMETYKWYYHLISAERATEPHRTAYKLAGPLCDGGDVYFDIEGGGRLPDYRLLPEKVEPGEVLALLNVGAYSLAQAFPYNGRILPAVVLVAQNGEPKLIRRPDTFDDLIANDIW